MKCPLLIKVEKRWFRHPVYSPVDCLKEECAWWDRVLKQCSVRTIAAVMDGLLKQDLELSKKMPHEVQSRK